MDVFGEQVVEAEELPALAERFAGQHRSVFARLSSRYREDRAALAALTHDGVWGKTLPLRLDDALAWQNAAAEVDRLTVRHQEALSGYVPRGESELTAMDSALAAADRIAELTREAAHRDLLTARPADGTDPDPLPGLLARGIRGGLADWCGTATRRAAHWADSSAALHDLFEEPRQAQLSFALFGTFDQAQQAVDELRADPRGPEEWQAYRSGVDVLARHGIDDLVPRAVERGVLPEQLPAVVEQAVLKHWADDLLATDTRLAATRSADLDARVTDFREADRRLVVAASGAVIEACNKRRPRRFSGGGGPGDQEAGGAEATPRARTGTARPDR